MKKEENYRNFINYPVSKPIMPPKAGKKLNCCGFVAATGDATDPNTPAPVPVTVTNVTTWNYIKTGFALVGIFVIGKYLYTKFIK
jgi:hypothetical protein